MNYTEAKKYLARAEKSGYVKMHSGFAAQEIRPRWGGNTTGKIYGINIDGDGTITNGVRHLFGCPRVIWDAEDAEKMFPTRQYVPKMHTLNN